MINLLRPSDDVSQGPMMISFSAEWV